MKTPIIVMLAMRQSLSDPNVWEDGLFDKDSWQEIMQPWAQTVVTGRARLGGIPVGVIAVETRTVEVHLPADPANLDSEAKKISQAGQVWFPDSAYKTAQAIQDFSREDLPLIIFANWRGFSGGMKDMYEQIMKFGAYIVDGLRKYTKPIIIYIPPHGELRGGAWAVVDPTINPRYMEMYADADARGGVLEPEGIVEIKYRKKDLIKAIHRIDPLIKDWLETIKIQSNHNHITSSFERKNSLSAAQTQEVAKTPEVIELETKIANREALLMPMYHQVAVHFADLHDTPERMHEKGTILDILTWKNSRRVLYWRLKRLILQDQVISSLLEAQPNLGVGQTEAMLRRWFVETKGTAEGYLWDNNQTVVEWLEEQMDKSMEESVIGYNLHCVKKDAIINRMRNSLEDCPDVALDAVVDIIQKLNDMQKAEVIRILSQLNQTETSAETS
ncbi:acetyl-CoA carboxylase-like [Onthophagus taurus]|uniref:acetyl-CoA carboxylase-like n=1 Tax=Onthophagus taurus TaxID=166361 RepID=UPI0039BDCF46